MYRRRVLSIYGYAVSRLAKIRDFKKVVRNVESVVFRHSSQILSIRSNSGGELFYIRTFNNISINDVRVLEID